MFAQNIEKNMSGILFLYGLNVAKYTKIQISEPADNKTLYCQKDNEITW